MSVVFLDRTKHGDLSPRAYSSQASTDSCPTDIDSIPVNVQRNKVSNLKLSVDVVEYEL
jgi:hypothetical protein